MRATKSSRRCVKEVMSYDPTETSSSTGDVVTGAHRAANECEQSILLPLSKSLQKDMTCEAMFVAKHIEDVPEFQSDAARRGTDIHGAISAYVQHLVATRQQSDYDYLRSIAANSAEDVREILERFTESFIFDPEAVLYVEKRLALDAGFEPIDPSHGNAAYAGTPDLVSMLSETECRIDDWKSQFAIADADSFEGMFYPLLMFCHNPALEKITFVLNFVRYGSASRQVVYERSDLPRMQATAQRERSREYAIYTGAMNRRQGLDVPAPAANPGRQCTYCPIVASCPLSKLNPYLNMTPEQRLAHAVWLKGALAYSTAILRDVVTEHGPIDCGDDAGNKLRAEFRPKTIRSYPLPQALPILNSWRGSHPGDGYMLDGLCVSGLSSPLKAKKRELLAGQLGDICQTRVQTELKIGVAKDEEE